ncbi:MAG: FISUMP domain-containing protein [Bacteroidales bacterium]|nr:FISUMP domain-containing protein [Bacteroidales bacterium]
MKKSILLFLILSVFIFSCKKDKDDVVPEPPKETVTDANGNIYNTVTIGTQTWMATNLKVNTSGSYIYNNSNNNVNVYGRLYTWEAAKSACPSGWRLPTQAEFVTMSQSLGGNQVSGGKMKNAGTTYWQTPNTGGNNASGFNGMPGGYRNSSDGVFFGLGQYGFYWTSTDCST